MTAMTSVIQSAELVKETSTPPRCSGISRLISNCSIGLCIAPQSPALTCPDYLPNLLAILALGVFRIRPDRSPGIAHAAGKTNDGHRHQHEGLRSPPAIEPITEKSPDQKARDHIHQHAIGNVGLTLRHLAARARFCFRAARRF